MTREQWQIRNDPVSALDDFPELAAEFDLRWKLAEDQSKTIGERMKEMRALATQILTREGVIQDKRGAA